MIREKESRGYRAAVITSDEDKDRYDIKAPVMVIGSLDDEDMIAHRLFSILRELDDMGIEYIYSESFDRDELGGAIMNRLLKAAGHRVVRV